MENWKAFVAAGIGSNGEHIVLHNLGNVSTYIRLFSWVCICMPRKRMDVDLVERIRPLRIGGYYCWCDRRD